MRRRLTNPPSHNRTLVLSAVFPALCVYSVLLWFIHMCLILIDFRATKAFVYEPWLGPFHLAHVLSFVNVAWALLLVTEVVRHRRGDSRTPWRSRVAVASTLILLVAIQFWVAGFGIIAKKFDNMRIRPDQEMVTRFEERKSSFEEIVSGLEIDMATQPDDESQDLWGVAWRLGEERWRWYMSIQRRIRPSREIIVSQKGSRVVFVDAVNAIGTHGTFKGYLYSKTPPTPLLADLETAASTHDKIKAYRSLGGNWYLYLDKRP